MYQPSASHARPFKRKNNTPAIPIRLNQVMNLLFEVLNIVIIKQSPEIITNGICFCLLSEINLQQN